MGTPKFHVVKTNEFGLSGIANPDSGVGRYGGTWGSMHRPTQSLHVNDCAITNGEVELPPGYSQETYNAEFLQFDLSIVNVGEDWTLPTPSTNPELFVTWPCHNTQNRSQLKDFVIVSFTSADGAVHSHSRPGLFHGDTFAANGVYFVNNRYPFAGQREQMNHLPDGIYKVSVSVSPSYGESVPAVVWVKFTGQDIEIQPDPVGETFPQGLVWKTFRDA